MAATTEPTVSADQPAGIADPVGAENDPANRPRQAGGCGRLALGIVSLAVLAVLLVVGFKVAGNAGWIGSGDADHGLAGGLPGVNSTGESAEAKFRQAPDFAVPVVAGPSAGSTVRLADLRGRPVLVNFWASWCEPCRTEAPLMEKVWREYRDKGVVFVGIDIWDDDAEARKFLEKYQISYVSAQDSKGVSAVNYGVRGIPESFFIGRDGQITRKWVGPFTEASLRTALDEVLASGTGS